MKLILLALVWSSSLFGQGINEKILFAAARGEIESLNSFLESDSVDLSYTNGNGYSALDYAMERNQKRYPQNHRILCSFRYCIYPVKNDTAGIAVISNY